MLRFGTSNRRPARNYFSRREQWRLFMLILPLGLVIIMMRQLSNPENGAQLNRLFEDKGPAAVNSVAEMQRTGTTGAHSKFDDRSADDPMTSGVKVDRPVDRDLLATIEDNTYFRNAEQNAWLHLLDILDKSPAQRLSEASTGVVDYMQLTEQPNVYRGRTVTVRGEVRQVTEQTPAKNELGISSYYRVVVQPDNQSRWPIIIYCLDLPENLAVGDTSGAMSATGFFFKNLSYQWQDGLGIAPVLLAKTVRIDSNGQSADSVRDAVTPDKSNERITGRAGRPTAETPAFAAVLELAGWGPARLAKFGVGESFSEEQRREALELLRRLRTFDAANLAGWASEHSSSWADPVEGALQPGQLVRLDGRVTNVTRKSLPPEVADRLEMQEYYECKLDLADSQRGVVVLTARVPRGWLEMPDLDEPTSAVALYLRNSSDAGAAPAALFLASELAWFPDAVKEPFVSFGKSLLGMHGMDVGLLDNVSNHRSLGGREREAFYQMLNAVGRIGASQLSQFAQRDLPEYVRLFQGDLESTTSQQQALTREVIARAAKGRYSVAPLFNDADGQMGRLFVFDGVARRVIRVEVGVGTGGRDVSDVLTRFGIDHYYEIELFTDDSQNRPLVFCVRELPEGFPTSGNIEEPVRLAGIFFKSWHYHTHDFPADSNGDKLSKVSGRPSIAPLLVGRAPIHLRQNRGDRSRIAGLVGGGAVSLAVVGVCAAVWWWGRSDRRFFEQRLASNFSLPEGDSLDGLQVADQDLPISSDTAADPSDAGLGELK